MIKFRTLIEKFGKQGEKTGWTYIVIPFDIAEKINKGIKKSYRVKGLLDKTSFEGISILPMGEGNFILPLKADLRKKIRKNIGDYLEVQMTVDKSEYVLNEDMMTCLLEEKEAYDYFMTFPRSHQNYYSKWVDSAKTEHTKAKRIAKIIHAMYTRQTYAEMLKS